MFAQNQCFECLKNLTLKTIDLSFEQKSIKKRGKSSKRLQVEQKMLTKKLIAKLKQRFAKNKVPAALFTDLSREIKKTSKINNAFLKRKQEEMSSASGISRKMEKKYTGGVKELLLFSVLGNSLDFFKSINKTNKEMQRSIKFSRAHFKSFLTKLKHSKTILFFADNSGEVFFDLPLIKYLSKTKDLIYVVKSQPVQNDLTIMDLKKSAMYDRLPKIMCSGNDAVGMEYGTISKSLQKKIISCDLIIAKGMGYYETFSELGQFKDKIFYLLMAKCSPVAKSLNSPLNSYLFLSGKSI